MSKFLDLDGLSYFAKKVKNDTYSNWTSGKNKIKPNQYLYAGRTETVGEVTFTINSDYTITANSNGASIASSRTFVIYSGTPIHIAGDIISGGISNQCFFRCEGSDSPYIDYGTSLGNATELTAPSAANVYLFIRINPGNAVNVTFKPMICTATDWQKSQTYFPYAMSNVELTTNKIGASDYASQNTGGTVRVWTTTDGTSTTLHISNEAPTS